MGKLNLVIMAGQSNMVGYKTHVEDINAAWRKPIDNAFIWQKGAWQPLQPGGGYQKKGFGPELAFAHDFCQAEGARIGIVKVAKVASYLTTDWNPDREGGLFSILVDTVRAAMMSEEVVLRGVLWVQGEADSITEVDANAYKGNLESFVARLRMALGAPHLPFIAAIVNPPASLCPHSGLVRAAIRENGISSYATVKTSGLAKIKDDLHYSFRGLNNLGKRMAQAVISFDPDAVGTKQHFKWLWNSDQYQCWVSGPGKPTDVAIVSMPFAVINSGFDEVGFGQVPIEKTGRLGVYIRSNRSTWLQDKEIMKVAKAIRHHLGPEQRIITYGASMGAYGALLLSKQLKAEKVLAIAPQYSIDRTVVPFETRWRHAFNRIQKFVHNIDKEISPTAQKVVFYDRMSHDRRQIEMFKTDETWNLVNLPFASHQVLRFLQETGSLPMVLADIENGGPDVVEMVRTARKKRRLSIIYWMTLTFVSSARRPDLADFAAKQALSLGGPKRRLARYLKEP